MKDSKNKKKILILTSSYYPKPDANGVCVSKIAEEFNLIGYNVHLIGFRGVQDSKKFQHNNIHVHTIKMPLFKRIKQYSQLTKNSYINKLLISIYEVFVRVRLFFHLPLYPITSLLFLCKYYLNSKKLFRAYNFDVVLSTYKPIESAITGALLKIKNPDIKFIIYILDSLPNSKKSKFLHPKITEYQGWRWEKFLYKHSDKIINMKCHENYYANNRNRYYKYINKMEFHDFPLITKNRCFSNETNTETNNGYHLVYSGSLDIEMRNPSYLCKLIENIKSTDVKLDFYTGGNCEGILEEFSMRNPSVINRNGFIKHDQITEIIHKADFLISIGNKDTDMVPSKIFEYMATGKPIIHFYYNSSDSSLPYLKNYPLALSIEMITENVNINEELFVSFMQNNINKKLTYEQVKDLFPLNTPNYTIMSIETMMN